MAEHDRLQLFHCSCFLNGAIWMKLWLELSFVRRHSVVSACQKDISWMLPGNRRQSGRSLSSNKQACSFTACISWSGRVGCCGGGCGGNNKPLISISVSIEENKRLPSKYGTTTGVYDMISYGDNKSWWIRIMTPLALAAAHTSSPFPSTLIGEHAEASSASWLPNGANPEPASAESPVSRGSGGEAIFWGQGNVSSTDPSPLSLCRHKCVCVRACSSSSVSVLAQCWPF